MEKELLEIKRLLDIVIHGKIEHLREARELSERLNKLVDKL